MTTKVKALHTIVHDGQTLAPGTIFTAPQDLIDSLTKSNAIEIVKGDPVATVDLSITKKPATTAGSAADNAAHAAKVAADRAALLKAEGDYKADGLDPTPIVSPAPTVGVGIPSSKSNY